MILVAGVGNIFLGDDGFGCAVVERLGDGSERALPDGVRVRDFGIRGYDLALALGQVDAAVLVDATARGSAPGTLYVLELDGVPSSARPGAPESVEPHSLTPNAVLRLLETLGGHRPRILLVGCEPLSLGTEDEPQVGLTPPVSAAVDEAAALVRTLVASLVAAEPSREKGGPS